MLSNRSIPSCTVIPELAYADLQKAASWLSAAFGFTLRVAMGGHRAQMNVGEGAVVLTETGFGDLKGAVLVRVADVDAHCARARKFGAKVTREPETHPYGERQYRVEDPGGHRWTFSQSVKDVAPEEWGGESGEL